MARKAFGSRACSRLHVESRVPSLASWPAVNPAYRLSVVHLTSVGGQSARVPLVDYSFAALCRIKLCPVEWSVLVRSDRFFCDHNPRAQARARQRRHGAYHNALLQGCDARGKRAPRRRRSCWNCAPKALWWNCSPEALCQQSCSMADQCWCLYPSALP